MSTKVSQMPVKKLIFKVFLCPLKYFYFLLFLLAIPFQVTGFAQDFDNHQVPFHV